MTAIDHMDSVRNPSETKILRLKQVQSRIGLSRSSIYLKAKSGNFPSPIKLGSGRSSGWLEHEIDQWIEQQVINSREVGGVGNE